MKKIYLLKKEADGSISTLGEYDSTQAASNAAMEMCGTDGNIFDYDIKEVDVDEPRISSYEEACAALGKEPLDEPLMRSQGFRKYEIARRKLETIVAALNIEARQRASGKETDTDNMQTDGTIPLSDVTQPVKTAMSAVSTGQELGTELKTPADTIDDYKATEAHEPITGETETDTEPAFEDISDTGNSDAQEPATDDMPQNDPEEPEYYIPVFFGRDSENWECRGAIPATGDMPSYGKDLRFTDSDTAAHAGKTFTELYKQLINLEA